ncbi:cdc-6 [Pristionchus pacificus]|nr:cdc-6 [Pristionchus pacificus]
MVETRRGRTGEVKLEGIEGRKSKRNVKVEIKREQKKSPIKKSGGSPIKKQQSPTKKTPVKKIVLTASPGRTTYTSKLRTPTRNYKKMEVDVDEIRTRMDKCVLQMSPPLSQDSAISMSGSQSKSTSSLDSRRDDMTPSPSECNKPSTSSVVPIVPLKGREEQFNQIVSLVDGSIAEKKPLFIYISGSPGTGKTATTALVLKLFTMAPRKIKTCIVNCTSLTKGDALCAAIMNKIEKPCPVTTALYKFTAFVSALTKTFILVLDEADFVEEKALTTIFSMPASVSSHLIVIGIANKIDLTERTLRKIKLKIEPVRMVFPRYSKDELAYIIKSKMEEEMKEGERLDATGVDLCARKVSAVNGDVREGMSVMRQSCARSRIETSMKLKEEEENMQVDKEPNENVPSTPVAPPTRVEIRHIADVSKTKYCPLASACLPLQPRVLLALCLKLSAGKKKSLSRITLFNEYRKASSHKEAAWPMVESSDLNEAFEMLVSQGYISMQKDQMIRMQVDSNVARSVIIEKNGQSKNDDVIKAIDYIMV